MSRAEKQHCLHRNRLHIQSVSLQLFEAESHLEEEEGRRQHPKDYKRCRARGLKHYSLTHKSEVRLTNVPR